MENNASRRNPKVEPDNYYLVTNPLKLRDGISHMLTKIEQSFKSNTKVTLISNELAEEGTMYGASYDPSVWYGILAKRRYHLSNVSVGEDDGSKYSYDISYDVVWNAAETFEKTNVKDRLVMTLGTSDEDRSKSELKRVYADEIPYDFNTWAADKSSYVTDSETRGALKYLGSDVVLQILNESVSAPENASSEEKEAYEARRREKLKNPDNLVYVDKLVRWLLGDHRYEGDSKSTYYSKRLVRNNNQPLRLRTETIGSSTVNFVLGDIINSDATYFDLCEYDANGNIERDENNKHKCQGFLAVGANDGMLHIINETDGTPVVSYMPSAVLSSVGKLVEEDYNHAHQAYVDSTPVVYEVASTHKKYLYGTYGLGIKGGYLLNLTGLKNIIGKSPKDKFDLLKSGSDRLVVWELKDSDSDFIGKQRVAPIWLRVLRSEYSDYANTYLVYASGYDSVKTGLLFVDMFYTGGNCLKGSIDEFTPCIVNEVEVNAEDPWGYGRKNALGTITDLSNEAVTKVGLKYEALYWGDLFGNVWKLDLSAFASAGGDYAGRYYDISKWGKDGFEPKIIFKAYDTNGVAQPITTRIAAPKHPYGGVGLIFGTGGLWTAADQGEVSLKYNTTQSLYMIRDGSSNAVVNASNRDESNLVHRCQNPVDAKTNPMAGCLMQYVFSSDDKSQIMINPAIRPDTSTTVYGWYLDLADADGESYNDGARIYTNPVVVNSYNIDVSVNIPNVGDACHGGGSAYKVLGDWTLTSFTQTMVKSEPINDLYNEGQVFEDPDGNLGSGTTKQNGGDPNKEDDPLDVFKFGDRKVSGSSWMKLY